MYRTKHFRIEELVDPAIFQARGERAWELLRPGPLRMLDLLREKFGRCTVNNWHAGGSYKESGLRRFDTGTGAKFSMHKYGGAFDCKFEGAHPAEVYSYVLENPADFPLITTVEDVAHTPSWFHFDDRNHSKDGIWIVKP